MNSKVINRYHPARIDIEARKCVYCKQKVSYKKWIAIAWFHNCHHTNLKNLSQGVICRECVKKHKFSIINPPKILDNGNRRENKRKA